MSLTAAVAKRNSPVWKFPANFLWGTAISPTQVEGPIENEWTNFIAQDGGTCRIACDHYHRYPEDIEWMSKLGVNSYRFGIEWSRLQSKPFGPLNQSELARSASASRERPICLTLLLLRWPGSS